MSQNSLNDNNDEKIWATAEIKLLISIRTKFEKEKKSILWDRVIQEIKRINPKFPYNRDQIKKKFDNLKTTYKRIQLRNHLAGRIVTRWEYFDEFDKVYGIANYSKLDTRIEIEQSTLPAKQKKNDVEQSATPRERNKAEAEHSTPLRKRKKSEEELIWIENDAKLESETFSPQKKRNDIKGLLEFLKQQIKDEECRHQQLILLQERKIILLEQKLENEKKIKW